MQLLNEGQYAVSGLILGLIDGGYEIAEAEVGSATIDNAGNASGTIIGNKGPHVGTSTISASVVMHPDCTFTWTFQDGELFSGVALIKSDRVELHMVKVNPPATDPTTGAVVTYGTAVGTLVRSQ